MRVERIWDLCTKFQSQLYLSASIYFLQGKTMTNLNSYRETKPTELKTIDDWARLERFLILGSEEGVYYTQDRPAATRNLNSVKACLRSDGLRVVRTIVDFAASGRAPKNTPALEVLALASSASFADQITNATALAALPEV